LGKSASEEELSPTAQSRHHRQEKTEGRTAFPTVQKGEARLGKGLNIVGLVYIIYICAKSVETTYGSIQICGGLRAENFRRTVCQCGTDQQAVSV
jgi:hypothetical protein